MRRTPSATSALLQRATSQLKGERVKKPESDIDAYISSLTEKTAKQKKSVNFEDIGEISISSNIDSSFEPVVKPSSRFLKKPSQSFDEESANDNGSKFLKKPTQSFDEESANDKGSKFLKKPQQSAASPSPAPSVKEKFTHGSHAENSTGKISQQSSAALSKASAVASKITQRSGSVRKVMTLESDSDESLMLSRVGKVDKSDSSGSVKIGRDGGKFLKKTTGGGTGTPLTAPPLTSVQPQPENIVKHSKTTSKAAEPVKKASPYQLRSSLKYSTNVVLTSEEESLAEYIDGLQSSSADSAEKTKSKKYKKHEPKGKRNASPPPKSPPDRRSPSPLPRSRPGSGKLMRPLSPDSKPPAVRRTPSPSPRTPQRSGSGSPSPKLRRRSPSPRTSRSLSDDSNIAESLKSEIAEDQDSDEGFKVNIVMDLDELGPVAEDLDPPSTRQSRKDKAVSSKSGKTKKGFKDKTSTIDTSPFKSSEKISGSPFKKSESKRPSSLKGSENLSKSKQDLSLPNKKSRGESPSLFKASDKTGGSPFRASEPMVTESLFKTTSKTEDSVFRATARSNLSHKALEKGQSSYAKDTEKKKTPDSPIKSSLKNKDQSVSELSDHKVKKKKTVEFKKNDDFFSAFGLQTVEDLFGQVVSKKDKDEESVASEVSEADYDFTEEIKTEMSGKVPVFGNRFSAVDSASEVATEIESRRTSYSEDFESISERVEGTSRIDKTKSASEIGTHITGDETGGEYTEEFDSDTESVATVSRTSETSEKTITDSYSYSDEESYTKSVPSTSSKFEKPKKSTETKSAGVQTLTDALHYHWNMYGSGFVTPDTALGLGFVDPTPIATHVVSSDALEAMTAYSPAMLALHDMLKQQLQLTREFVESQKYLYKSYLENIESSYRYTTLKDTKNYIRKHRKKILTFKEALRLVDAEMPYNR